MLNNVLRSTQLLARSSLLSQALPVYSFASNQRFANRLHKLRQKNPSLNIPSGSSFKELQSNYGLNQFVQRV